MSSTTAHFMVDPRLASVLGDNYRNSSQAILPSQVVFFEMPKVAPLGLPNYWQTQRKIEEL